MSKPYLAVIDTNVLVSALLSKYEDAATFRIYTKIVQGEIVPLYSQKILDEYSDVLNRKKFKFSADLIETLLQMISDFGICIDPKAVDVTMPDIKDLPFYEVVMDTREHDSYLVTGNMKHFPEQYFIVTPRQMIEIIEGKKA